MGPINKNIYLSFLRKRGSIIVIAVIVFYFLFILYFDAYSLIVSLSDIGIDALILTLLCVSFSIFIRSIRQFYLLVTLGIRLPFNQNLLLYLGGLSMSMTPGSLGQAIKSYFLYRNYGEPVARTIPLVLTERYLDILAIFVFVAISVLFIHNEFLSASVFIVGLILLALPLLLRFHGAISCKIKGIFPKTKLFYRFDRFQNKFAEFDQSLMSLLSAATFIYGWPISMCAWFFEALAIFFSFKALNIQLDFELTTAFGFSSLMFGAISLVPGGAGVTELTFLQLLTSYGIPIAQAAAAVLLVRISSLWYSTLIGVVAARIILRQKKMANPSADSY